MLHHATLTLPRELTDIPDQVRTIPAPPLPVFPRPYGLRVVDPDADAALIAEWMSRPHLVETWDQAWPAERWLADSTTRLAGTYSRPYILSYDDTPVGYVELYRFAKDECAVLCDADPWDLGFHIATGDTAYIGRGLVSGWMAQLGAAVWAAEPQCRRVYGDPDHRNTSVRRALTKAGHVDLGEFAIRPTRRIALYCRPRVPGDLPDIIPGESR